MRRVLKRWLWRLVLLLIVLGGLMAAVKRDEISRLMAVNSLFDADRIVDNFSHMDRMFLTLPLSKGPGPVSPLPAGAPLPLPEGFEAWQRDRAVTALVVLKDGALRHEGYYLGTGAADRRISWSVAKSFLSVLFGIVLDEGAIGSIDDKVTKYAPSLAGSAYDGARIRDVLQMSSGVEFDEDYMDFWSDINKMGRVIALGQSMDAFTEDLGETVASPGQDWHYVSIDTHVIGMVIRGATGRDIPDLIQEKLLDPLGLEADPYYVSDGYRTAFVLGGLNMPTRDYARFGQMVLQGGEWQGHRIVPRYWLATATAPSANTAPGAEQYGYQWWIPADAREGEFYAIGVYGQYIYVNRPLGVVIAAAGADRGFTEDGVNAANIAMFRKLAEAAQ